MQKNTPKTGTRILFTGGGTLGSVTPLLAVYHELERGSDIIAAHWIGTRNGPERSLIQHTGIPFTGIVTGKLRRYLHWRNIVDPIFLIVGFVQAWIFLLRMRPSVIVNAGSYVGAPVIIAGWFLGIPSVLLQLDIEPVRTNLLTAPFARIICLAVSETARYFSNKNVIITGIPVRTIAQKDATPTPPIDRRTLVVVGGGTGAQKINELVLSSLSMLTGLADVIHYTGLNKGAESISAAKRDLHYHPIPFGTDMMSDLARADVVVTRAGMGTLAELAALGKASLIIPIPSSPQERNAAFVARHDAGIVLDQRSLTPESFVRAIRSVLMDEHLRARLSRNIVTLFPRDAASRVAKEIRAIL